MKGILVRAGVDQAYGGWNAPVDLASNRFAYVPIPERAGTRFHQGCRRCYAEFLPDLRRFAESCGGCFASLRFPGRLRRRSMHLDPDFRHLTYGDNGRRRGAGISRLHRGDLLVFYAGLRSAESKRNRLVYAIIGLYVVESVVPGWHVPAAQRHENAHTRRARSRPTDIVVRAQPGVSGRLARCIPIGEYRHGAYRVRRELIKAWGGLSVHNGYIQRSAVPPTFRDAARFYRWFCEREVPLVQRNN